MILKLGKRPRRVSQKRAGFNKILILPIVLAVAGGLFPLAVFLKVKNVYVDGSASCVEVSRLKSDPKIVGQNLLFINRDKLTKLIEEKNYCLESVQINKKYPDTIEIKLFPRSAAVFLEVLQTGEATNSAKLDLASFESSNSASAAGVLTALRVQSGQGFLADKDGVILSSSDLQSNLPKISLYWKEKLSIGQVIDDGLVPKILKVLEKVSGFGLGFKEAKIYSDKFLYLDTKPFLLISLTNDIDLQLASLQLILNKAKIENADMSYIDLRFDKPIVKFLPK